MLDFHTDKTGGRWCASERAAVLLALAHLKGLGNRRLKQLLEPYKCFDDFITALFASDAFDVSPFPPALLRQAAESALNQNKLVPKAPAGALRAVPKMIDWFSTLYPERLRALPDPPPVLYALGDITLTNRPLVCIAGTRTPDDEASAFTTLLAKRLSERGFYVASGFADGIDWSAHIAAVILNCPTVAVLGAPFDALRRTRSQPNAPELIRHVVQRGLFLTEQPIGARLNVKGCKAALAMRNRLIAALSAVAVFPAVKETGGAFYTAIAARKLGVKSFTVDWRDMRYQGNLRLMLGGACALPPNPELSADQIIQTALEAKER